MTLPNTIATALTLTIVASLSGCGKPDDGPSAETTNSEPASAPFELADASGLESYSHETGAAGKFWFPESMGPGVGVIDYNSDGLPDVLVAGGGRWDNSKWKSVWLFRNDGDLTFTDVTDEAGLAPASTYSMGVTVADYDRDGREDFLLTSVGGVRLYRNAGGTFVDATRDARLSVDDGWSTAASFFDGDADGDLDLLIGHYVSWTAETDLWCSNDGTDKTYCTPSLYEGEPLTYYRNDGGRFVDGTARAGFDAGDGKTLGIVAGDVTGDGLVDVYVANDTEPDQLFRGDGSGKFEEIGLQSGIAYDERGRSRAGMGVDIGDIDGSGKASLVVGNFAEEMIGVYQPVGGGIYTDRSAAVKIGMPSLRTLTFGLALVDVDLDGSLDLVAANGHIQPEIGRIRDNVTFAEPPHVFLNDGSGAFHDGVAAGSDLARPMVARGLAYADLDRDGDPELLFVENSGTVRLWKNDAVENGAKGVVVQLRREDAASPAIDALVELYSGGKILRRWVKSGGSYLSSSQPAAFFGVAGVVDSIRVVSPGGATTSIRNVEDLLADGPVVTVRVQ